MNSKTAAFHISMIPVQNPVTIPTTVPVLRKAIHKRTFFKFILEENPIEKLKRVLLLPLLVKAQVLLVFLLLEKDPLLMKGPLRIMLLLLVKYLIFPMKFKGTKVVLTLD